MEHRIPKRLSINLLILMLATGTTLATFLHQRSGPFMGVYGNICGPGDTGELCVEPVLQGGWPLPYVFDVPTISVPYHLDREDQWDFGIFALDVAFFAGCIKMIWESSNKGD